MGGSDTAPSRAAACRTGWIRLATRAWAESSRDNIGLIAAGVAFYGFLAMVPLLGASVLTYGLFADAADVANDVGKLFSVLPGDAAQLIGDVLDTVVKSSSGKKGLGLLVALALALFGARNAAGAIITALNVAYEQEETRGFLRVNLLALAITAAGVATFVVGLLAVAAAGYLHLALPSAGPGTMIVSKVGSYLVLGLLAGTGAAALYWFGPAGDDRPWRWLTPGSILFAVTWVVLTAGFGFYVANFGHYGATYGSLGAVVVLLTWMYLSAYALLFGGELNSELEKETERGSGSPKRPHSAPETSANHRLRPELSLAADPARASLRRRLTRGRKHLLDRLQPGAGEGL